MPKITHLGSLPQWDISQFDRTLSMQQHEEGEDGFLIHKKRNSVPVRWLTLLLRAVNDSITNFSGDIQPDGTFNSNLYYHCINADKERQ